MYKSSYKILFYLLLISLICQPLGAFGQETAPSSSTEIDPIIQGTVIETIFADGYSYIGIDSNGQTYWAVTRGISVIAGDEVEVVTGSLMKNFTSKSLDRTFEEIVLTGNIVKR